jgi:hypothetical protein
MGPTTGTESPFLRLERELRARGVQADVRLPSLELSSRLIKGHVDARTSQAALAELAGLKEGHQAYLSLDIERGRLCGLEAGMSGPAPGRPPPGAVILSSPDHFKADVVVARCMDNRCTCPSVELNKRPYQVCEVVSAGHVLEPKDLDSLAVGIGLKGAKVILLEAHGGACGAIQLALGEKGAGDFQHAVTRDIAPGLEGLQGSDSPHVFAGTLKNLDYQLGKVLDPALNLGLLRANTGRSSFLDLFREGRCLVIGVYVDFEVIDNGRGGKDLIKRLSFFDSIDAVSRFIEGKIRAYDSLLQSRA